MSSGGAFTRYLERIFDIGKFKPLMYMNFPNQNHKKPFEILSLVAVAYRDDVIRSWMVFSSRGPCWLLWEAAQSVASEHCLLCLTSVSGSRLPYQSIWMLTSLYLSLLIRLCPSLSPCHSPPQTFTHLLCPLPLSYLCPCFLSSILLDSLLSSALFSSSLIPNVTLLHLFIYIFHAFIQSILQFVSDSPIYSFTHQ